MRLVVDSLRAALLSQTPADLMTPSLEKFPEIVFLVDFDVGKADLKPQHIQLLDGLKTSLQSDSRVRITRIVGHASETGGTTVNQRLSNDRARAVATFLGTDQMPGERPQVEGRGSVSPLEPNPGVENKLNRRVVIHLQLPPEDTGQSIQPGVNSSGLAISLAMMALPGTGFRIAPSLVYEDVYSFALGLEASFPGWKERLPACPLRVEAARGDPRFVEDDEPKGSVVRAFFHRGAAASFRSLPGVMRNGSTEEHYGQQCTYDENGDLITQGEGAGTPDLFHSDTYLEQHQLYDVLTWQTLGWYDYNRFWVPNPGPDDDNAN